MITVKSVAYHRIGIGGAPFWVVLFEDAGRAMVAVAFDDDEYALAVLDVGLLAAGNIRFGENSWRYEYYAAVIRTALPRTV